MINKEMLLTELDGVSMDDLRGLYQEANSWDGSFEFIQVYDIEELCEIFSDTCELVRAVIYGSVDNICDPVRFDAYGNLETVYESDMESDMQCYLDELADWIIDNDCHVDLSAYGIDEDEIQEEEEEEE